MDAPTPGVTSRLLSVAAAALAALAVGMVPGAAHAQVIPDFTSAATSNTSCLATRAGGALNCTANDFTTQATLTAAPNTSNFCEAGQTFTFTADVFFQKGGGGSNYDIGFFAGETGNNPNAVGGTCSVATVPGSPAPLNGTGTNSCGDWNGKGSLTARFTGLKVTCAAGSTTASNLAVPYVVSWSNSSSDVCTGPTDVKTTVGSKCQGSSAQIVTEAGYLIQVGGYVDVTKQTLPDADPQSFTYTVTGASGSVVGYQSVVGGVPTGLTTSNNTASASFSLTDGQTMRVYMSVVAANRTLTITEQPSGQVAHWQGTAAISCSNVVGAPGFTTTPASRQIQAALNTTNSAGACTITNTKRARIALVKNVPKRLAAADQFTVSVTGAGSTTLTNTANTAIAASAVTVTTSGATTGNFTNATNPTFRATPNQVLTLTDAMAGGSTSPLSSYVTSLTCTNAFSGPGATTGLPSNSVVSTYNLTPAPGDDITCTWTNTPKAKLTLAKTVVNDDGQTAVASAWTLSATGPATISGVTGAGAVTGAVVPTGTYTLSESGPVGYVQTGLVCTGAADGNPADGLTLAAGEIVSCTFTNNDQPVGQTVVKGWALDVDADGSSTVTVGDTLRYTVTVTNTGSTALTNVTINDAKTTPASKNCASVAPAGTCVLSGTYVVVAGDQTAGSVSNTATVTSTQIPGPVSSNTTTTTVVPPSPAALAVAKSHSGNFSATANATYTLQVSNTGGTAVTGTTKVTDTLAAGLTYVSATGTNWTCGAVGQLVTCTSTASVGAYGNMTPITLTVAVAAGAGSSIANTASVANTTINGNTPVAGNTDTATILHADLSTSAKTVANLGGGATADVDSGDVLEYAITLIETAGAAVNGVQVTDTVQSGLGSITVTSMPPGATNFSSGSLVDIRNISIPASGSVQVKFRVTVGGTFTTGDAINNTATVVNPTGPGATPAAPLLTYQESQIVVTGGKRLYLRDDQGSPTAQIMDRTMPAGTQTGGVAAASAGGQIVWTMSPTVPAGQTLELNAGSVVATFPLNTAFNTLSLTANLYRQPGNVLIGSGSRSISTPNTVSLENFAIALNGSYAPLTPGQYLTLALVNSTNGNNKNATVYAYYGGAAMLSFSTSTIVHVDSVDAYAQAYASGNTQAAYYVLGNTMYVRAVGSDPFGGADVGSAEVTITDAGGNVVAGPAAMTTVATTATTRTFEYPFTIPQPATLGSWTASVKAWEGTEGTISHTASGSFNVRGKVTLGQTWGSGAVAGNTVLLQVTGAAGAVDGSSVAPGAATPATAAATASLAVTLVQSFTVGNAGAYTVGLSCTRDADGGAVAITGGSGLSRQINMPLDSSVTCIWTDTATVPLTIVKLAVVRSDPVNGTTGAKAIPGAIVEYQVIVTNPSANAIDADSVAVADPLPSYVELSVADIASLGSGPVQFVDGSPSSNLSYTFTTLGGIADDVAFSNDGGATWTYQPVPDVDGIDANVTNIRINPKGAFAGNNAQFTLKFRVRVK